MNSVSKKVLLVDDDPDIVLMITVVLEDAGYEVVATGKGDCLEYLIDKELPGLILLDMLLSGSDGRDIARQLKEQQVTRNIPILMLSAHPHAAKEAKAAGADDFLAKPFEIDELLARVATHLP